MHVHLCATFMESVQGMFDLNAAFLIDMSDEIIISRLPQLSVGN